MQEEVVQGLLELKGEVTSQTGRKQDGQSKGKSHLKQHRFNNMC